MHSVDFPMLYYAIHPIKSYNHFCFIQMITSYHIPFFKLSIISSHTLPRLICFHFQITFLVHFELPLLLKLNVQHYIVLDFGSSFIYIGSFSGYTRENFHIASAKLSNFLRTKPGIIFYETCSKLTLTFS